MYETSSSDLQFHRSNKGVLLYSIELSVKASLKATPDVNGWKSYLCYFFNCQIFERKHSVENNVHICLTFYEHFYLLPKCFYEVYLKHYQK